MPSMLRPCSLTILNCLPQFEHATVTCSSGSNIMLWDCFRPGEEAEVRLLVGFEGWEERETLLFEEAFLLPEERVLFRERLEALRRAFRLALLIFGFPARLALLAAFFALLRRFIRRN